MQVDRCQSFVTAAKGEPKHRRATQILDYCDRITSEAAAQKASPLDSIQTLSLSTVGPSWLYRRNLVQVRC